MLLSLAVLVVLLAAAAPPATACSMSEEYVRPSDFELVQISDAIVIATAREERPVEHGPAVAFEVEERVKGVAPGRVEVRGNLEAPDPSGLSGTTGSRTVMVIGGGCGPELYRKGDRYLLFLQKDKEGQLRRTGHSLSRTGEKYAGEDSAWMHIVRRYVRLQAAAAPMEQIAILKRFVRSRRGLAGEALSAEEVRDIRDHLRSISPYKPTAYLLAAYADLERGRMLADGVRARGQDLATMRRRVLTALVNGNHPGAMPLFDRLAAETPEDPDRIGLALRYFARNGAYDRAFRWIETRLMKRLAQLDRNSARRLIGHVEQMQMGEEGEEPWRSHARAVTVWPELALSLYWHQVRAHGPGEAVSFEPALRTLPLGDYRARPLLTLALASGYDEEISRWAVSELSEEKRMAWEALPGAVRERRADPAELPLKVLLSFYQEEHEALLERVFCQSEDRGLLLIRAFGEAGDSLYTDPIRNIAASAMTEKQRALLPGALARWARRNKELLGASIHSGLAADLRRGRQLGEPIGCGKTVK